jgi:putative membrane protein
MKLLLRWILSAVALYVTVVLGQALNLHSFYVAPGAKGVEGLLMMVLVLGVVNAIIRPIVQLIALPLSCLTFGLLGFVINALMFWLAGQVIPGFHVAGWEAPLFGSVVMGLVSGALNNLLISDGERRKN